MSDTPTVITPKPEQEIKPVPKMPRQLKVLIGIPTYSDIDPEFFENLIMLMLKMNDNKDIKVFFMMGLRTQNFHARNLMMDYALETNCDYLFMVDDDMLFPSDALLNLLAKMEVCPDADVIAALAFKRKAPYESVMYTFFGEELISMEVNPAMRGLIECDAVGFGGVVIRVDLLRKMNPPFCLVDPIYQGSDVYFCHKAKKYHNAKIYCDTTLVFTHLGEKEKVNLDSYLNYRKEQV